MGQGCQREITAEAILGWLNGSIDATLEQLIDDLTPLWLLTGDGAADHARKRLHGNESD